MSTIIVVEHDNQHMHASTPHVLAAALHLDPHPIAWVIGAECRAVADEVAALAGVSSVWLSDNACYQDGLAEPISQLIYSMADEINVLMAASTTYGKNMLPRVAALLNVAQVSDVTRVVSQDTFEHPIYAGNAIETLRVLDDKKVLTIRPTAFTRVDATQAKCPIKTIDTAVTIIDTHQTTCLERKKQVLTRPELTQARRVVSGGRGLQSKAQFALIDALADSLNAAVGASRAAVDAGFVANDCQVGQTGKVVAPELYIAVGISGAIQHLAGMKDSKVVVAINKDPDAPIFQVADYALVGDLFVLVPQLIEQINALK